MTDNEVTALMAYALVADTMGYLHNCDHQSSPVVKIYSKSKTEPNTSEYRPDYLFVVRQRRF